MLHLNEKEKMEHKEEIIRLRNNGLSYRQIEEELGCSKSTISYHVGEGQKEKSLIRQKENREAINSYIRDYKESNPCKDCNNFFPYYVMDFDHLKDKSFQISRHKNHTKKLDVVKQEIDKCELVCSNCHRIRTNNRKNGLDK